MAITRQGNWLGSMRVDVPHLRLLESSVAGDFQALVGTAMTGTRALVAWGMVLLDSGMVGQLATNLYLRAANAVLMHGTATEAGAIFTVASATPDDILNSTNSNVVGSFAPSATNYVSVDLTRVVDSTTADAVVFRDAGTKAEFTQTVPLGRVLQYRIYISTSDFTSSPTRCPIAKVVTDAGNLITSIVDCRQMYWRLGTGGVSPLATAKFTWGSRVDAATGFTSGDKDIVSQYDFNRAITTRLWELGGGERWFSPADDRSVKLTQDPANVFIANSDNWYWDGTNLLWQGLRFIFGNSTATYNTVNAQTVASPGLTNLADGECIYVDVNRATNATTITPVKTTIAALLANQPTIPGSRYVIAWRVGIPQGWASSKVYVATKSLPVDAAVGIGNATVVTDGLVKIASAPFAAGDPVCPVVDSIGRVVANGITRDTAGTLVIGTDSAKVTAISIGLNATVTSLTGQLAVTGGVVNGNGITSLGNGSGAGVAGTGGTSGIGVIGQGQGAAEGVKGTGGITAGAPGVTGTGGLGGGLGVIGLGLGAYSGGRFTGGSPGGNGVEANGTGTGSGLVATIGTTGLAAVWADGTTATTNGTGVHGIGKGTGNAVEGVTAGSGAGVLGTNSAGTGPAGQFAGNTTRGTVNLVPQARPSTPVAGDVYYDTNEKAPFYWESVYGWNQMGDHTYTQTTDITTTSSTMADVLNPQFGIYCPSTGGYWTFEMVLRIITNDAAGFAMQFVNPGAGLTVIMAKIGSVLIDTANLAHQVTVTALATPFTPVNTTCATAVICTIYGTIQTSAGSGNVVAQFKSNTNGQTTTIQGGSTIRRRRVL
jgi:hypothetical protein